MGESLLTAPANPIVSFRVVSKQPIEPWKYSAWESA